MTLPRLMRLCVVVGLLVVSYLLFQYRLVRIPHRPVKIPVQAPTTAEVLKPQLVPGVPKRPSEKYTKTLVLPKVKKDDVSWTENLKGYNISIYHMDDREKSPTIPENKGREAMAYLTYIIDHYDNLPDVVAFFHAHGHAWHNNILLSLSSGMTLEHMNPAHVVRQGYFPSRCHQDPGCPDWLHLDRPWTEYDRVKKPEERDFTKKVWQELHPGAPFPASISEPCCAQFAVSGERIRTRPRSDYEYWRQWLLQTSLGDQVSGRVMEYTWQYIFAAESEFCPSMHKCYCDGYGICFGGTSGERLDEWLAHLKQREEMEKRMDSLRKWFGVYEKEAAQLQESIKSENEHLDRLKEAAFARGNDPRARAAECERPWEEGDGF